MKRCPTCQKEFADSMRFCQTDGTPLVEVAEKAPPPDPYKTVVGGSIKMDDDLLQIPEKEDPMKTMVSPMSAPKTDAPPPPPPPQKPISEPLANMSPPPPSPPREESKPREQSPLQPPKFNEPNLSPPSFGDSSPSSNVSSGSLSKNEPPKFDSPKSDPLPPPPPFGSSPFSNEPGGGRSDSPFSKPSTGGSTGSSPFDKPASSPPPPPQQSSPFDKTPPPPYKDPEPMFGGQQAPPQFNQTPFGQPQTPFGQQNEPFNQPFQQNEWAPPPAPVAGWQDQGLGANTPFQPPMAGGQNNTLAIVSLVCGILSICLCGIVTGIPALITGFMAKNKADTNPAEFGGRGMALAGMITGGIGTVLGILGIIYYIILIAQNM